MSDASRVKLMNLERQRARLHDGLEQALRRVIDHGKFILGPEVAELEQRLASFCSVRHAVSCGTGTDALELALRALDIGQGDAVFVPAFTFVATAEAVAAVGATPVFVDVDAETFNLSPASLQPAVGEAETLALRPRAVIAVDLYGLPADYQSIGAIARTHGMRVIADAAQSFGGAVGNARVGTLADITTTSFFPSKPLGCFGDGGAVLTADDEIAQAVRSLRVHGMGKNKYDNVRIGMNSRLDTLQAAVLLQKMTVFEDEIVRRDTVAKQYAAELAGIVETPRVPEETRHAWALYTAKSADRDGLMAALAENGIDCGLYYVRPLHRQPAYEGYPVSPTGLATTEDLCRQVISLPMDPYLEPDEVAYVCRVIRQAVTGSHKPNAAC